MDGNYVTFDSVVIMEYFIGNHCHLQKKEEKKSNLKFPKSFLGGTNLFIKVCVYPISSFKLIPP